MRASTTRGQRALAACGLAAVAVLAAACGSSGTGVSGSSAAPTRTVTVTATPSASPTVAAGLTPCPAGDLRLTVGAANGAAGTIYYPLDFTNASGPACTMYGYPGVAFVTAPGGAQVGAPAARSSGVSPALITLQPGGEAHATLAVSDVLIGNNCQRPLQVSWVQAYPPGQYTALYAPLARQGCADPALVTSHVTVVSSGP